MHPNVRHAARLATNTTNGQTHTFLLTPAT